MAYSFFDYQFWIYAFIFLFVVFIAFFLPGFFILSKYKKISPLATCIMAVVLGIVLWGVQGYILGFLNLRFLSFVYVIASLLWGIKKRQYLVEFLQTVKKEIFSLDRVSLLLIGVGIVLQLLPMVTSGMRFSDGIRFYFINGTDGVMHLSYIQSIIRSFPPMEPGAVGLPLVNYHYWSDLVIADSARVFSLPVTHLFFQFFPFLISLVTSLAVYMLIRVWGGSVVVARWALFLLFLSGDGAYIIYYLIHQNLSFNTPAIDNGVTQFFNMPHAFAKMIFITGLIPLHLWVTQKKNSWGILSILFFAPLFGFKVYYGLFAACGFSLLVAGKVVKSFIRTLKKEGVVKNIATTIAENTLPILFLVLFAVISSLIYFPPNSGSGGLIFSPLEWPKLLLGEQALNFREWWLRIQVYEQAGNTRNIFIFNTLALIIALMSIHGTRLLGFLPNKKLYQSLRMEGFLFLIPGVLLFTFLGFFTLQESGLFNVFNFFVVSLVVLSLFASFTLSEISQKNKWYAKVFIFIFIVMTIPRVIFETSSFVISYRTDNYKVISNDELEALSFLKKETAKESIIQSHPKNRLDSNTPYVSFFSDRSTYFTGGGLMATHNQPTEDREKRITELFTQPNANEFAQNMKELGIAYVYVQKEKEQEIELVDESPLLKTFFENKGVIIYQYVQ